MAPPALLAEGEKVQSEWLFQFLKNPGRIRPWLKVRMPNFRFSDEEANTLVQYFMASTNTGTFDSSPEIHENLADGQQIFTTFQCASCHVVGAKVPEGKTAKNRVHLDVFVGPDQVEAVARRWIERGAIFLHEASQGPHSWITLADPEGNEVCLA